MYADWYKKCAWSCIYLNGVFKSLLLKVIDFSLVQDMEQFYELWLKSQKNEKSDDVASQSNKENGKQIHMPTDYAEVTVSTVGCLTSPLLPSHRRNPSSPAPHLLQNLGPSLSPCPFWYLHLLSLQWPAAVLAKSLHSKILSLNLFLTLEPENFKSKSWF